MQAKRLPHSIKIQKPTITKGTSGGQIKNWEDYVTRLAFVKPLQGREYFAAKQVQAETSHKVTMWYQPGIASEMRVVFGTRVLEIESVINVDERNIELQLMCVDKGEVV